MLKFVARLAGVMLALAYGPALADNYVVKDGNSAAQTFASKLFAGVQYPVHICGGWLSGAPINCNIDSSGNLGVNIQNSPAFTVAAYVATGNAKIASVTTSSSNVALGSADATAVVTNTGSVAINVKFGTTSGVAAATTDTVIQPGAAWAFATGSNTYLAAITATGSSSLTVSTGTGNPQVAGGGGGGVSSTVTANAGTNLNTSTLAVETGGNLAAAATSTATTATDIGPPGATVCATDTGSCSQNAQLQRLLQRLTTLINALGSPFQSGGSIGNTGFTLTGAAANVLAAGAMVDFGTGASPAANTLLADTHALAASVSTATPAGTNHIGSSGDDAAATDGVSQFSALVPNNTTSVAVDASPGTLKSLQLFNNSATIAYLKLYNAAQGSTTCGSGTPVKRIMIPANTSGTGDLIPLGGRNGVLFSTAITYCVTTGIADADTTAPAASTYIVNADYK